MEPGGVDCILLLGNGQSLVFSWIDFPLGDGLDENNEERREKQDAAAGEEGGVGVVAGGVEKLRNRGRI